MSFRAVELQPSDNNTFFIGRASVLMAFRVDSSVVQKTKEIHSTVVRGVTTDDNDAHSHSDSNKILSPRPVEEHTQQIPIPTTTGNQIYTMQRKARDALAECMVSSSVMCGASVRDAGK